MAFKDLFDRCLSSLKKNGYGIKKDKLILDYRIKTREDFWKQLEGHVTVFKRASDDYNIGWWCYTNGAIVYSDLYCTRNDFESYIKGVVERMKI